MTDKFGSQSRGIDLELVARFRARFCLTNPSVRLKVLSSKRHFVECVQWIIYYRCQKDFLCKTQDSKARVLTPEGRADI